MTRGEDADTTSKYRGARRIEGPGKSKTRGEIQKIRLDHVVRIARRAEIHFAEVCRIGQVVDLRSLVGSGFIAERRVDVVPHANVEHQPPVDAPVILDEETILVQP